MTPAEMLATISSFRRRCLKRDGTPARMSILVIWDDEVGVLEAVEAALRKRVGG